MKKEGTEIGAGIEIEAETKSFEKIDVAAEKAIEADVVIETMTEIEVQTEIGIEMKVIEIEIVIGNRIGVRIEVKVWRFREKAQKLNATTAAMAIDLR